MKNYKNWIILILSAIVLGQYFWPKPVADTPKNDISPETRDMVSAEVKRVNYKIDKKGFQHAVIDEIENTVGDVSKLRDSAKREKDSVVTLLNIKDKQLREWRQYAITLRDSFMIASIESDTSFRAKNKWANFEFVIPKDKTKSSYFNYTYNVEANYSEYWKKKNFLASKKYYIDFWVNDTNATINGVKRLKIVPTDKTHFELNAITIYDRNPSAGFEGSLRKGRLSIGAGGVYDLNQKEWRPIVIGKFKLIDF
jgi:hypothetical protein